MLEQLSIRNIVLIEKLDLTFEDGLCVLTGETGAGKSILLDSLALALGARADTSLLRAGADQGSVTATFSLVPTHPVFEKVGDIEVEPGEPLILRRSLGADGRSRASINDQVVSAAMLLLKFTDRMRSEACWMRGVTGRSWISTGDWTVMFL